MSQNHQILPLLLSAGLLALAAPAHAQLNDVGLLPGGTSCSGLVVNNDGTVAGTCDDAAGHFIAFRRLPSEATPQPLASIVDGKSCDVVDMNNANVISGNCEDENGEQRPVRWQADGTLQILEPRTDDVSAAAGAINQNGVITGTSDDRDGTVRGVVWLAGQTVPEELPMSDFALDCTSADLNDESDVDGALVGPVVAGTCDVLDLDTFTQRAVAVRWQRAQDSTYFITMLPGFAEFPPFFLAGNCAAVDINANRQIAGTCSDINGDVQAVRWQADDTVQSIETAADDGETSGTSQSTAVAINAAGRITGTYRTADGFGHAFLWNPDNPDVNDNFLDIPPLTGGFGSTAVDLAYDNDNDDDTVIGVSQTDCGVRHAFRWRRGTGPVDLGTLGGFTSRVSDLSDDSRIVGTSQVADGHNHAFVTAPPPP